MSDGTELRLSVLGDIGERRRRAAADLLWLDSLIIAAGGNPADYSPDPLPIGSSSAPMTDATPAAEPVTAKPAGVSTTNAKSLSPRPTPKRKSGLGRYGRSVREMVREIVSSEPRWWTTVEILDALKARVGPLADDKLPDNMRTAVYTSKKEGEFEHDPERGYRLADRLDATDADAPVASENAVNSHVVEVTS